MADEDGRGEYDSEEIQGAPPVLTRSELRAKRLAEKVTLNRYLYQQSQQFEHMLLEAPDLQSHLWYFFLVNDLRQLVLSPQHAPPFLLSRQ